MTRLAPVAAADGTRLASVLEGEGRLVVLCNGLANNAYQWTTVRRRLARRARVLTWDYRGHGESEPARDLESVSIEATVDDLVRVLDAAVGPDERFTLMGYSLGCQVAYEAWRRLGPRIDGLVHLLGSYEHALDGLYGGALGGLPTCLLKRIPGRLFTHLYRSSVRMKPIGYAGGRLVRAVEPGVAYRAIAGFQEQLALVHGPSFKALALAGQRHSAADVLPTITAPLLLVQGGLDIMAPPSIAESIVGRVPQARYVLLERAGHTGLLGHADRIADLVHGFLDEHRLI
jgi:3-oxoadipate enol-lactonase